MSNFLKILSQSKNEKKINFVGYFENKDGKE